MDVLYSHIRKLKSTCRKTGTHTLTLDVDDGALTFTGKAKDGKVRLKGTIAADGALKITKRPPVAAKGAKVAADDEGTDDE
jgi:hypothetical protein